jgi:predicted NBD/HSP70 family sugar kinase
MSMLGGIDLGGTKIEACLFDDEFNAVLRRRTATPTSSFEALLDALLDQYGWLRAQAGSKPLNVGFGIPGLVEAETGLALTANLPSMGKPLRQELSRLLGFDAPVENDCKCFAMSEANGGAGEGFETVFGLILGTGCGAGVRYRGQLVTGRNGLPGEVGHTGISVNVVAGRSLPVRACKCGRQGCYETLVSGPGMAALARALHGLDLSAEEIAERAADHDSRAKDVLTVWADVLCELLRNIQATVDPDCIVLGGGLSQIKGVAKLLGERMPFHMIGGTRYPAIRVARFGDSSGVRGAAMVARQASLAGGPLHRNFGPSIG